MGIAGLSQQLKALGYLCGLVSEKGPNSEDLNRTVDLLAGLGAERPETGAFSCGCHGGKAWNWRWSLGLKELTMTF